MRWKEERRCEKKRGGKEGREIAVKIENKTCRHRKPGSGRKFVNKERDEKRKETRREERKRSTEQLLKPSLGINLI